MRSGRKAAGGSRSSTSPTGPTATSTPSATCPAISIRPRCAARSSSPAGGRAGIWPRRLRSRRVQPTPAEPSAIGASRPAPVYRRIRREGPMNGFGYSWFDDRLARAGLTRPRLLAREPGPGPSFGYEALNLVDGRRSVGEISDELAATVAPRRSRKWREYLDTLARLGVIEVVAKGKSTDQERKSRMPSRRRPRLRPCRRVAAQPAQAPAPPAGPPADREPIVSVTRHSGTFGGQRINYTATAGETFLAPRTARARGDLLDLLCARAARPEPAGHLPVQRRAGLGLGLAAHGRVRAEAGRDPVRRARRRRAALSRSSTIPKPARRHRHRLHRSGRHRLQPGARQDRAARNIGASPRTPSRSPSSSASGSTRTAAGTRPNISAARATARPARPRSLNQLEGAYNDVSLNGIILISTILDFGAGADTPGNEMTLHPQPAVDGGDRALSRQGAGRRRRRGVRRGGAALRDRPLCHGPAQGQRARRRGAGRGAPRARPLHRPLRAAISSRPTCGSRRRASTRSCCATAASPSAGSTPLHRPRLSTMPARRPTTIPASTASTPATPPRSTQHVRDDLGFRPTAPMSTIGRVGDWDWRLGRRPRQRRLHERRALYRPGAARE